MKHQIRPLLKLLALSVCLIAAGVTAAQKQSGEFHFALLGDRTGEAQAGVWEEAWQEAAAQNPAFVLTVGDTIQGADDAAIDGEWASVLKGLEPYRRFKLFLTPGNHDIWDAASRAAFEKYSHHPPHYSFDWQQAHFTILDDSLTDNLTAEELNFLASDLAAHSAQPVKFIVSHRPAWLISAVLGNADFPLQQLALKYGVKYVIAGHLHQMLHFELGGVMYLSMASSGGHLRNDKAYEHGWFFQHTDVTVNDQTATFKIEELKAPFGQGRVTGPDDWGSAGLNEVRKRAAPDTTLPKK